MKRGGRKARKRGAESGKTDGGIEFGQGFKGKIAMKYPGQIVLFRFPHASLAEGKTRPALAVQVENNFHFPWKM